jgi:uracil-DNA glycosylase
MNIQLLFDELEKLNSFSKSDFEISGMINRFKEMKYGFFPLGWGILDENNKREETLPTTEVKEGGVMILGNDFGTVSYVEKAVKGFGETGSPTILNLQKKFNINVNKTFFTNFYLGIRTHENATMKQRVEELSVAYKKLCYEFFIKQLELIKPKLVICLGHDVKNALIDAGGAFSKWEPKSASIKKLYSGNENNFVIENAELNGMQFIVIPHPCYMVNLKPLYVDTLNEMLKNQ